MGFYEVIYQREASQDKRFGINTWNLVQTYLKQILKYHREQATLANLLLTEGMYEKLTLNHLGDEHYDDLRNENNEQKDNVL
jgi:hypothetical protein